MHVLRCAERVLELLFAPHTCTHALAGYFTSTDVCVCVTQVAHKKLLALGCILFTERNIYRNCVNDTCSSYIHMTLARTFSFFPIYSHNFLLLRFFASSLLRLFNCCCWFLFFIKISFYYSIKWVFKRVSTTTKTLLFWKRNINLRLQDIKRNSLWAEIIH